MKRKQSKVGQAKQDRHPAIRDEQASTIDNAKSNSASAFDRHRPHSFQNKHGASKLFGKGMKSKINLKTIVTAIISAVVIGLCLGFIMLNMFDGIGHQASGEMGDDNLANTGNANSSEAAGSGDTSSFSLEPLHAFVLQAGVFSGEENANKWAAKFEDANHPVMIWPRDDQFTLLAGIANSETEAKTLADSFSNATIYVKEWSTDEVSINVTSAEQKWLESFVSLWGDSVNSQTELATDKWKKLIDDFPKQAPVIGSMKQPLTESFQMVTDENSTTTGQKFLLEQWLQYEKIGKSGK